MEMTMAMAMVLMLVISGSKAEMMVMPLRQSISESGEHIHRHINHLINTSTARFSRRRSVSLPLSPGSDYTLTLTIPTTPPQTVSLYMDTGSDLVWFPCHPFECIMCEGKPNSSFPHPKLPPSSSVSCKSPACAAAHSSPSPSDLCAAARCPLDLIETSDCASFHCPPFYYAYADGSLVANLHTHTLLTSSSLPLPNFTFACSHTALAEPIGVAGFGRGLLSLPAQLSPHLGNHFSYCLVSHSLDANKVRRPSPLILGRYDYDDQLSARFAYTAMLDNPKHPYLYSVGLLGVSVGKKHLPAPELLRRVDSNGSGGMVVDSGTTFTMLPATFYEALVSEFDRRVGKLNERATDVEEKTGLKPCYYSHSDSPIPVPPLTLHFAGNHSDVVLPRRNYFYHFTHNTRTHTPRLVGCLMLINAGDVDVDGGPGATLGNYQQQGFEVVYDLDNRRLGFAKRKCSMLWDALKAR